MMRNRTNQGLSITHHAVFPKKFELEFLGHQSREIGCAARITPFIVIPGDDFDQVAVHHHIGRQVNDGRAGIAFEIHGDQWIIVFTLGDSQDTF
jgi:hypothetical protein